MLEPKVAKERAARLSVMSNTLLVVGKLSVGTVMGSVSVISEGIHSGLDLVAAVIAWASIRAANKPADEEHPYGHGKIENVSGTIEAILIFIAAFYIIVEAGQKFYHAQPVESLGLGALVMGVSAVVNWLVSRHLLTVAKQTESIALEADAWHLRTDVYTSLGVLVGLLLIKLTGIAWLDPVVAIIVALMIIRAAYELTKQSFVDIIDARLPDAEEQLIREILQGRSKDFVEFHKLRTRKAGAERHVDLHLVVYKHMTVQEVHDLSEEIESALCGALPNCQVLIHFEPCTPDRCDQCSDCENINS